MHNGAGCGFQHCFLPQFDKNDVDTAIRADLKGNIDHGCWALYAAARNYRFN